MHIVANEAVDLSKNVAGGKGIISTGRLVRIVAIKKQKKIVLQYFVFKIHEI